MMSAPPARAARRPTKPLPGTNAMTRRATTTMMAPATPGQRRSGFPFGDPGPVVAIVNYSVRSARQIDAADVSSRDADEATLPA